MPKRLIGEARRLLEQNLAPVIGDYWTGRFKAELEAAEAVARDQANKQMARLEKEVKAIRDSALKELTEVRDGLEALAVEGKRGRISATDYNARLGELRQRQSRAEEALADAGDRTDLVEEVENEPVEWFDQLARRQPTLMREFSW
jgi:hypothetical protein